MTTHNTREEHIEEILNAAKDQENDWFYGMSIEHRQLFYNWIRCYFITAAQEKEEAVAEVVERWRKSIDDEARSCSVKIEEAVNEGERKMLQRIRNRIVLAKPVLRTAEQQEVRTMFLHEVDVLAASLPPLKKTPPKNISSNETTV